MIAYIMLKSTRRRIFYALLLIFLVFGTGVVEYADGWRFDFSAWRLEKVGQIYVRSFPGDAALSLDGKPVKNQTGFLTRGTLVDNLLPRTYGLTLQSSGYAPWRENISVAPSVVTELKYAVLVPRNATTVFMGPLIAGFPTRFGVVTQAANGTIALNGTRLASGNIIGQDDATLASQIPDIIVQPSFNGSYYAENLETQTSSNLSALFLENNFDLRNASSVVRDGYESVILAENPITLVVLDENTQTIASTVHASSGVKFITPPAIAASMIGWAGFMPARGASQIYAYYPSTGNVIRSSSTVAGRTMRLMPIHGSVFAVLQSTGDLFQYDADSQIFRNLANDVVDISVSRDGTMLAARERASIEVFALNGSDYWRLNVPDQNSIQDLVWYRDNRHLFLVYPNKILFLDLADASLVNLTTIATGILPHYDADANVLYMLDNERNLIRFDFPN
jgi:hypothetical protein